MSSSSQSSTQLHTMKTSTANISWPTADAALLARMRIRVPIVTTATTLAILLGVVTSLLLLTSAIYRRRKERIFTTVLFCSLSLACFTYSAVVLVFFINSYQQFEWLMGRLACKIDKYLYQVLSYAIVYQLVLLTCYIYVTIRFPTRWITRQTNRPIPSGIFITGFWLLCFGVHIEAIFAYDVVYSPDTWDIFCFPLHRSFQEVTIAACFHTIYRWLLPSLFMLATSIQLFRSRHYNSFPGKNNNEHGLSVDTGEGIMSDCKKTAIYLTASLVVLRGPNEVYNFIDAVFPNMPFTVDITIVIDFVLWLFNVYFAFVPLILLFSLKNMRLTVKYFVKKWCTCRNICKNDTDERKVTSDSTCVSFTLV